MKRATTESLARCQECRTPLLSYPRVERMICQECRSHRPQKQRGGETIYLLAVVAPAHWRDMERYQSGKSFPLYYRDEAGVIWEKSTGINGEYERWDR